VRITIDIPKDLVNEAMRITQSTTQTELIKNALYNIVQKSKIKFLKNYKGKIDLNIDLNSVRGR